MQPSLKGQIALVTGASSGIGAGVALALGAAGASVVVNYVTNPGAAEAVAWSGERLQPPRIDADQGGGAGAAR